MVYTWRGLEEKRRRKGSLTLERRGYYGGDRGLIMIVPLDLMRSDAHFCVSSTRPKTLISKSFLATRMSASRSGCEYPMRGKYKH
jgi:hypothetical protein